MYSCNKLRWVTFLNAAFPAPSNQAVRILIENPLAGKACQKILTKSGFDEFTSLEKCAQLLLIKRIHQSKKFNKPSYYLNSIILSLIENQPKVVFIQR